MKLPSIHQVWNESARTFRRFPLILIDAAIGTVSALILLDHEGAPAPTILFNILFAAILGIPLLLTIAVTAEKWAWKRSAAIAAQVGGVLLLAAYALTVPTNLSAAPSIHFLRLAMLFIGLHFLVSVVPYAGRGEMNGFWQYNKTLLFRTITAALFSLVLFAGLAIALAALDNLFGFEIPPKRYAELWVLIVGIFTTWFFLGGIPERLADLETSTEYPKVIKIFAQYILLPLVLVYFVILYAYMGKILIAWDWPQGWVSRLILGFATAGMFMHLLFHPVRDLAGNVWIKTASRWFYVVMIPLVIMLLLAVWRRLSEYGVTEGRYVAVATGLWLAAIVLYFIFSKGKSLKAIPGSLGIVILFMSFGPWSAFNVSESSQINRLHELLLRTSIIVGGSVHPAEKPVGFEDTKQISSIVEYLHEVHGYDGIQSWFRESLRNDSTAPGVSYKDPSLVTKMMGVEYVRVWEGTATNSIDLSADGSQAIAVAGYDRLWRIQVFASNEKPKEVAGGDFGYSVGDGLDRLTLYSMKGGTPADSLRVDMNQFLERLLVEYRNTNASNIAPEKLSVVLTGTRFKSKVCIRHVSARRQDGRLKFYSYDLALLYSLTPEGDTLQTVPDLPPR
jgi:hypothetical protein